ncbi:S-adenosyl-L-methionine-dependent methyltransferase [Wilcoxina mikolae CBS 423.85]|nr:S-adenosyl-L-methionine-dependent methyltransferase [Wilcoxina mikolae CBS 423.85]
MSSSFDNGYFTSSARSSTDNTSAMTRCEPISVDPRIQAEIDNGDIDYSPSDLNETFSVTSSIYEYRVENGRTYHRYKDGAYMLPNDEIEQDRLDIVHHLCLLLLGGRLTLAPIDKPKRVLDVGTGTGIWAIAMADHLPEDSEIIGTDLSPIQPTWVPPNCRFEIDDAECDWTFPTDYFDFIHTRHLALSIRDWPAYIARLYRHLAPGGWIEINEHGLTCHSDDGTFYQHSPLNVYLEKLRSYAAKAGFMVNNNPGAKLKKLVKQAGFVDVEHTAYKLPWGPWPEEERLKELGKWAVVAFESGASAYGLALLTRVGGLEREEAQAVCDDAVKNVKDKRLHVCNYQHFIIARKPRIGEKLPSASDVE